MSITFSVILPLVGLILGWTIRWLYARFQLSSSEQKAERIKQDALREADAKKKELLLETKDQLLKERSQQEKELRDRRIELQKFERFPVSAEPLLDEKHRTGVRVPDQQGNHGQQGSGQNDQESGDQKIQNPLQAALITQITGGIRGNEQGGRSVRILSTSNRKSCRVFLHVAHSPFAKAKLV